MVFNEILHCVLIYMLLITSLKNGVVLKNKSSQIANFFIIVNIFQLRILRQQLQITSNACLRILFCFCTLYGSE
ncbi:hypothetical protein CW304_26460 [Bacillus sp. UFRGS-B20]|nr:hypothetical protein CW304_26460 [Bacillus sp. UFRGS-B20]